MKKFQSPRLASFAARSLVLLTAVSGFLVGLTFALGVWSIVAPGSLAMVIGARLELAADVMDDWQVQSIAGLVIVLFAMWLHVLASLKELASMTLDPGSLPLDLVCALRRRATVFAAGAVVWSLAAQVPVSAIARAGSRISQDVILVRFGMLTFLSLLLFAVAYFAFRFVLTSRRLQTAA